MAEKIFDDEDAYLPPISEEELSDELVLIEIQKLKDELVDEVVILGHHYQQDDIVRFADITGDSLKLAQEAAKLEKPYIIFCGVHFMAETADMLTKPHQKVILPDLKAGCSMADMADRNSIEKAWTRITKVTDKKNEKLVPITYINCSADLKAFVGEHNGSICTSSNAKKIITWGFNNSDKLIFFPDQHLGRNTSYELGIPLSQMVIYDPHLPEGGLSDADIENAKVILWYGYCSVHQGFTKEQCDRIHEFYPKMQVIVHPECPFDVVQAADGNGSTAHIVNLVEKAPAGSEFAIGTEINLVNRLAKKHKDKRIISLSPYQCLCTTMYRVRPRWLLASLRAIKIKKPINIITVSEEIRTPSLKALSTMLEIS